MKKLQTNIFIAIAIVVMIAVTFGCIVGFIAVASILSMLFDINFWIVLAIETTILVWGVVAGLKFLTMIELEHIENLDKLRDDYDNWYNEDNI